VLNADTFGTPGILFHFCSLANLPFLGPRLWELLLRVGVFGAGTAATVAVALLILTVSCLQFNLPPSPASATQAAGLQDAPLVFDTPPKPAAIFAFASLGTGVMVGFVVFLVFCTAHGLKILLGRRYLDQAIKKTLDDYV
jgi:hypothetical protein